MFIEILFYIALLVCIATVFVVAIKGFQELMAPIKAEKAKRLQKEKDEHKGDS